MKRTLILSIMTVMHIVYVYAAPGCMDNSWHLTKCFDSKEYHYVQCTCPCERQYQLLADRNTCSKCKHYRDPRYSNILSRDRFKIPYLALKKKVISHSLL